MFEIVFLIYQIATVLGIVGMLTIWWLPFFLWKKLIPLPSRKIFWAARRRQPLALIVHDSGRSDLTPILERRGEGLVVTDKGKYKLLPRIYGRPEEQTETSEENGEQTEDTEAEKQDKTEQVEKNGKKNLRKYVVDFSDWVTKRSILIGFGNPIFVGYSGKICLVNPEILALYEAGEMMIQTEDLPLFNPKNIEGKKIEDALQPLLLVEPRKLKEIIYRGFDDTQETALAQDSEMIGLLGRGMGKYLPWLLIGVVAVIALLAVFFLPQLIKGLGGGG